MSMTLLESTVRITVNADQITDEIAEEVLQAIDESLERLHKITRRLAVTHDIDSLRLTIG